MDASRLSPVWKMADLSWSTTSRRTRLSSVSRKLIASRTPLAGPSAHAAKANSPVFSVRQLEPSRTRPSNIIATNSEAVGSQSHSLRQLVLYSYKLPRILRRKRVFRAKSGLLEGEPTPRMVAIGRSRCNSAVFLYSPRRQFGSLMRRTCLASGCPSRAESEHVRSRTARPLIILSRHSASQRGSATSEFERERSSERALFN